MEANHVGRLESALEVPSKGELRQEEEQVANQQAQEATSEGEHHQEVEGHQEEEGLRSLSR